MLTLHVEGKDYNELLANALRELHITLHNDADKPPVDDVGKAREKKSKKADAPTTTSPVAPQTPPSVAPAVPPAAAAAAPASPAPVAPTAPAVLPMDHVRAALHTVTIKMQGDENDATGLKRAQAVLEKFGAKKISAVKPEDYPALIAHCAEVVKGLVPA